MITKIVPTMSKISQFLWLILNFRLTIKTSANKKMNSIYFFKDIS